MPGPFCVWGKEKAMTVPLYRVALVREPGAVDAEVRTIRKAEDAAAIFRPLFAELDREQFGVLLLDTKHRALGLNVVSIGSLTSAIVHPREVFKPAILANSAAVILGHNHPSGDPAPSSEDIEITRRLRDSGELIGIRVLDSIIVGRDLAFYSFVDADQF
jgi:DNA repair protein RadC